MQLEAVLRNRGQSLDLRLSLARLEIDARASDAAQIGIGLRGAIHEIAPAERHGFDLPGVPRPVPTAGP